MANENKKQVRRRIASEDPSLAAYAGVEEILEELEEGTIRIKGQKGDKGDKGDVGEKGDKGEKGDAGKDGVDGKDGRDARGRDGRDGSDGKDGKDGRDGSPDTAEEIVEKINSFEGVIEAKVIKDLPDFDKFLEKLKDPKNANRLDISDIKNWNQPARGRLDQRWHGGGSGGDTSGLVPYVGATQDVDLGSWGLSANNLTVTGGGGFSLWGGGALNFFSDAGITSTGSIIAQTLGNYWFDGDGTFSGILDMSGISGSDKTFTFPNASGTVALTSDITWHTPVGVVDGSNTTYTVTFVPTMVMTEAGPVVDGFGYDQISPTVIKMTIAPQQWIRYQ